MIMVVMMIMMMIIIMIMMMIMRIMMIQPGRVQWLGGHEVDDEDVDERENYLERQDCH